MVNEAINGLQNGENDLFRLLAENSRDLVFQYNLSDPAGLQYINPSCLLFTGYSQEEFYNDPHLYKKVIHPDDIVPVDFYKQPDPIVIRLLHKNGTTIWVEMLLTNIVQTDGEVTAIAASVRNITKRVKTEERLRESEARFRELADTLPETVFETDRQGILTYLSDNARDMFGYSNASLSKKIPFSNLIHPEDRVQFEKELPDILSCPPNHTKEYLGIKKDGTSFPIMVRCNPILRNGVSIGRRGLIMDISAQKQTENHLRYFSMHDPLTDLYNRFFFEEKMKEFHKNKTFIGMIVADVDGLKIINDTLGHQTGDLLLKNTTSVLKKCIRPADMIARIGGDEFVIFLPDTPVPMVNEICVRIREETANYNKNPECFLPLSISVGWATIEERWDSVYEVFKRADDRMYRDKIQNRQNSKYSIIDTLLETIYERDPYSKLHAERLSQLVLTMAPAMKLSTRTVNNLCLFAQYHDIGTLGIDEKVLAKTGRLTARETLEFQRHCEFGHRIALSSSNLAPVADWILKHHEWWNGGGYPLALKGFEIPFECRWLAILHEYDTLVFPRPNRKDYTPQEALKRLTKLSGTQFDPSLVKTFINLVDPKKHTKIPSQKAT